MGRLAFGAIDKQRSGRFRARYTHPLTPFNDDGSPNRISAPTTFRTRTEAQAWLAGTQTDIAKGTWKAPEELEAERVEATMEALRAARTFGTYAATWLPSRRLTPRTRQTYEGLLRVHLLPQWANTPLRAITTPDVRAWLAVLAPGSPGARKKAYELFKTILATSVDDDLLAANPCKRNMLATVEPARAPQVARRKREPHALSLPELEAVAAQVPEYMRVPIMLAGLTGERSGELRFLHGGDVRTDDAGRVWIDIHMAVSGQGKNRVTGTPKTPKSIRSIPCPPSLTDDITALADKAGTTGLLFHTVKDSREIIPERTFQKNLSRAGERAGVGHVSPHDLRHTAASLARENGASATAVRDLLGHTTTSMTDRYTHTSDEELTRVVDGLDRERIRPASVISLDQKRKQA
ncbi:tyrosine-type recombinase/integrase [Changpingibacter yushuensis]|uniref:tyrosine-type recombinase/integrase n=1 Tax=Changpingibacter yushuensis TaxID=2758440 RepID=UPI0015F67001|nr:site-specific integrase [Changpingibacter yushuensis]